MKLFTSRYFYGGLAQRPDLVKVGITVGTPRHLPAGVEVDAYLRLLAPTGTLFHMNEPAEFIPAYRAHLDAKGVTRIQLALNAISKQHGNRNLVLLCFEDCRIVDGRLREWCHRLVFAEWWLSWTGEEVPELEHQGLTPWQLIDLEEGAVNYTPPTRYWDWETGHESQVDSE